MTARYLTTNRQLTFEITGATQQEVFEELAKIQEVFDTETSCGVCGGSRIKYQHRNVQGNDFHELVCLESTCRARFSFGHSKQDKGALFPKRKDKDGNWIPNRGWEKYNPPQGGTSSSSSSTGNRQQNQSAEWE